MNKSRKTTTKSLIILFIITCLLSSCSITKCRYSNGFNIDFGGKSKAPFAIKKAKTYNAKTEAKSISKRDTINDEKPISLNQITLNNIGENSEIANQKAHQKNIPIHKLKKSLKETQKIINNTTVKNFIQSQKPNKTSGILHILWKIIKFIIFLCFSVAVIIGMGVVAALIMLSAFGNNSFFWLMLIVGIAGLSILVIILGIIYQLFGYGPAQDVYNFCMSVFGLY